MRRQGCVGCGMRVRVHLREEAAWDCRLSGEHEARGVEEDAADHHESAVDRLRAHDALLAALQEQLDEQIELDHHRNSKEGVADDRRHRERLHVVATYRGRRLAYTRTPTNKLSSSAAAAAA